MKSKVLPAEKRLQWFHEARFGLFIHWGIHALMGRCEWTMLFEKIPVREYAKLADRFRPTKFDADAWARLAKDAGMKYMVLTTRHHDGFCLFDSKVSEFTSVKTAARRDFVAEYVRACRKAGLKVGLYYSLMDWRFPGYFNYKSDPESFAAMRRQCHDQVRELMTNYGKIDILWYDGLWLNHEPGPDDVWAKLWKSEELNAMVRRLQPDILINNRAGTPEDFGTPEGHVSAAEPGRAWEACMTMSSGWGHIKHDRNFKPTVQLLQHLAMCASGEGNFLLNIGPRADGSIRNAEASRLREMGRWLKVNGEAIYGSRRCTGLLAEFCCCWTRKGKDYYFSVFNWPGTELVIPLVKTKLTSVTLLATGRSVPFRRECNGRVVLYNLPRNPPGKYINVFRFRFAGEPETIKVTNSAAWLTGEA
jgi:alpha-L-fucosidase